MTRFPAARAALVLALATVLSAPGWAQTPAPKPAAKPAAGKPAAATAADGKTLSGKDSGGGKLLTRDELRTCMKQRDSLANRLKELEAARGALDIERTAIGQERQALATERENMAGMRSEIDAVNAKTKAFQEDVDAWNKRVEAFKASNPSGSAGEKQRAAINEEGEVLRKRQAALQAERDSVLSKGDGAVKAFNARAATLDQKVSDWNERNGKLNAEADKISGERTTWSTECGDRRYREDDEKAILSGG